MTSTDIQKYTKIFVAVNTDKDGKINGKQAQNLFLSWRLPREVLKQVWDLSDQDNDNMLSLREFCIALYQWNDTAKDVLFQEYFQVTFSLLYYLLAYLPLSFQQEEGMSDPGAQRVNLTTGRPQRPASVFLSDEGLQKQQKSQVPVLEKHVINQLSSDEQNSINSKFQEASEADKKTHVDCIQSDLDELVKSLNNRCKKYELRAKPTTLVELCEESPVVATEPVARAIGEPMDIMNALQLTLRKSLAYGSLARGLYEGAKVIEKRTAQLVALAEDCDQPDYVKLVKALCAEHL
ncbi:uncharacterized protein LOC130966172 [Arachis stenosperma]|uniref:uncharacterized protein LOC130966172 n=1 Tax=Arachis stenosperma TaxID=217475 RepID=UPI0025AD5A43|nr:uncharacterized protein LOC130966172 [Arachis stenosperma]